MIGWKGALRSGSDVGRPTEDGRLGGLDQGVDLEGGGAWQRVAEGEDVLVRFRAMSPLLSASASVRVHVLLAQRLSRLTKRDPCAS